MSPRYPKYPSQPNTGVLPTMKQMGPPDLRPTSSTAPYYQGRLDLAHGRYLAGLGSTEMEPAYADNELRLMAEMDDVQGNGIFDPDGSEKKIHPNSGVFAVNYNLPGYHAREIPFGFSEERDVTTGRPIRAVPSGAVANDSSAQIAYMEQGLYPRPQPMLSLAKQPTAFKSTVNVMQNAIPISGFGNADPKKTNFAVIALFGIGAVLLMHMSKKGARR